MFGGRVNDPCLPNEYTVNGDQINLGRVVCLPTGGVPADVTGFLGTSFLSQIDSNT